MLVYVVDPHPLPPDPSPYRGYPWTFNYSHYRQPRTFEERVRTATKINTEGVFDVKLADGLSNTGKGPSNRLWCSWGPSPNSAWLIAQNGTVVLAQTWFTASEINATLRRMLRR